jgi:hypothetical protein
MHPWCIRRANVGCVQRTRGRIDDDDDDDDDAPPAEARHGSG